MTFTFLSLQHQALINIAEYSLQDSNFIKRVLTSALYLAQREGADIHLVIPLVLFHTLDISFSRNILTSLEIYSNEELEKIFSLISFHQSAEKENTSVDSIYCILHDALLLNAGKVISPKEVMTATARQLLKERRSALRLFFRKKEAFADA